VTGRSQLQSRLCRFRQQITQCSWVWYNQFFGSTCLEKKISHSDVPDAPWYTLVHSSTLWYTLVHLSTLWYTLVRLSTLWYNLVHLNILWYTLVHLSILWYTLAQSGRLWYRLVHCVILWYTLVHCVTLCYMLVLLIINLLLYNPPYSYIVSVLVDWMYAP